MTSEVAKGKLHLILRLEVSQLSKPRVSDFGTNTRVLYNTRCKNIEEKNTFLHVALTKYRRNNLLHFALKGSIYNAKCCNVKLLTFYILRCIFDSNGNVKEEKRTVFGHVQ